VCLRIMPHLPVCGARPREWRQGVAEGRDMEAGYWRDIGTCHCIGVTLVDVDGFLDMSCLERAAC